MARWFFAPLALTALCLLAQPAAGDPAAQARFHDELARGHYKAGRFEQALREFFLEQRLSPNPRIAFNIALCFQELKRNEEAYQYFAEYLASADADPERRAYASRVIAALKTLLALVEVRSAPPGAEIYVDRRELGSYGATPKVVAVTPGEHEISVEIAGHRVRSAKILARRGEQVAVELLPERILGQLRVTSPVTGRVAVRGASGEVLGKGSAPFQVSGPPGSYEVRVTAPGYLPWVGVARIEADRTASVSAAPQLAPAPTGSITVTSNVPGALVELNGEPAGFSPTVLSNVKVGTHRVRVATSELLPWSGSVAVAAEERSWLTVSLEEPAKVRQSPATWIAGGIGAAALVTGGVLAIFAADTRGAFEDAPAGADRNALRERGETLNTATDVALITGVLATGVAAVLYFTTKEVRGRPSAASLTRSKQ
jgi:outer membrane receptor for ferrienterochelin and colicins